MRLFQRSYYPSHQTHALLAPCRLPLVADHRPPCGCFRGLNFYIPPLKLLRGFLHQRRWVRRHRRHSSVSGAAQLVAPGDQWCFQTGL